MGSKSSHFYQADRPESGGSNRDDIKEKSGLHELDKEKLAAHRAHVEEETLIPARGENPTQADLKAGKAERQEQPEES